MSETNMCLLYKVKARSGVHRKMDTVRLCTQAQLVSGIYRFSVTPQKVASSAGIAVRRSICCVLCSVCVYLPALLPGMSVVLCIMPTTC